MGRRSVIVGSDSSLATAVLVTARLRTSVPCVAVTGDGSMGRGSPSDDLHQVNLLPCASIAGDCSTMVIGQQRFAPLN